jgi:hypothetical protein
MQLTAGRPKIVVSADGTGLVSQAGGLLLEETLAYDGALCSEVAGPLAEASRRVEADLEAAAAVVQPA